MANDDGVSKRPIDELIAELSQDPDDYIVYNLRYHLQAGADVDVNALLTKLEPVDITFNLTALNEAGANINGDKLFASLEPQDIIRRFRDRRPDTGADADRLAARVNDSWMFSGTRRSYLKWC